MKKLAFTFLSLFCFIISIQAQTVSDRTVQVDISTTDDDGSNTGSITIGDITGGVSPYIVIVFDSNGNSVPPSGNPPIFANLGAGTYTVRVTDASGCSNTISVTIGTVNSVDSKIFPGTFNAFPNPTSDYLNLEINLNTGADFNWKIYDGRGQLMQQSASKLKNSLLEKIDVSNLARGIYMLTVEVENERFFKRVVVE